MDIWFTLFVSAVALLAAVGFSLTLVGYINSLLACFQYGWKWALTVLCLPAVGGIAFCFAHKPDHLKTGRQLLAGVLCLVSALALVYGTGPAMVRHVADNLKAESALEQAPQQPVNPSLPVQGKP